MKTQTLTILPLLAALIVGCSHATDASVEPKADTNGLIRLYLEDSNGQPQVNCVIPVRSGTFNMDDGDDMSCIRMELSPKP